MGRLRWLDNHRTGNPGVLLQSDKYFYIRDTGIYFRSSADGVLDIVSDTTLNLSGAVTMDSTLAVTSYLKLGITDTDGDVEGQIWYDASENKLKFYNGTGVETITSS